MMVGLFVTLTVEANDMSKLPVVEEEFPTVHTVIVPPEILSVPVLSNLPAMFTVPLWIEEVPEDWFFSELPLKLPIVAVPDATVNDPSLMIVPPFTVSVPPFTVIPAVGDAIEAMVKSPVSVKEVPLFILSRPLVKVSKVATVACPVPLKSKMDVIPDPLFISKVLKADVEEPLIVVLELPLKVTVLPF
jgi:hypothetical protein